MSELRHDTSTDAAILEALDFELACEYSKHPMVGSGPAAWVVTMLDRPCGCPGGPRLLCDPCVRFLQSQSVLRCPRCGHVYPYQAAIRRIEPLS